MTKHLLFSIFLFLLTGSLFSQTVEDAIRYSLLTPQGTARFAGTGGSMSPLGVDFTTLSTNPAGIGWARNGFFVITPGLKIENTSSTLLDGASNPANDDSRTNFTLPNIGLVFTSTTRSLYWSTFNFGIGINRLADFNETIAFRGSSQGSILESFVEDANDGIFNDFRNNLAFDPGVDALFGIEGVDGVFSDYDPINFVTPAGVQTDGVIDRQGIVTRTGGISELVLSFGGNYREKLMWGITLGVPFMNYSETREYDEVDRNNEVLFFDDLTFDESLETSGSGINFKFGLIYRPTQEIRVSLAAHSPTFWSIDETYETTFTYNFTDPFTEEIFGGTAESPRSEFAYNLQTPWRFQFGVGSVVGKKGFVSIDAEYVNYAGNKFSYDDFTTEATAVNEEIDELATSGIFVRGGGEINLGKFQARAGLGAQSFPFEGVDEVSLILSGGVGFRAGRFFTDLGYQFTDRSAIFQPYSTFAIPSQQVEVNFNRHNLLLSGGLYF
jgi:hypothetical protein